MQSGELIVTGEDQVVITLTGLPAKVIVDFEDDIDIVPCNPHHFDSVEYEVHQEHNHHHHSRYVLIIRWSVTGVRELNWQVLY